MTTAADLIPGQVQMIRLGDYLKLLTASADLSHSPVNDLIRDIVWDKVGDWKMGAIIDSIIDNGFTSPIELQIINDGIDADPNENVYSQGNGHHRLVAAILLDIDVIPVMVRNAASAWDIDFNSTTDRTGGNGYFDDYERYTPKGRESADAWRELLRSVANDLL